MHFSQIHQIHTLLTTRYVLKLNCIFLSYVEFTVELFKLDTKKVSSSLRLSPDQAKMQHCRHFLYQFPVKHGGDLVCKITT